MKKITVVLATLLVIILAPMIQSQGLDTSFGNKGIAFQESVSDEKFVIDMKIQPDDKLVVLTAERFSDSNYLLMTRYNADGSIDFGPSFDPIPNGSEFLKKLNNAVVEVLPDGSIIVASGSGDYLTLTKFLPNGEPDSSFGYNGRYSRTFNNLGQPRAIVVQNDRILIGLTSNFEVRVAAINFDGTVDRSFGDDGLFVDVVNEFEVRNFNRFVDKLFVTENNEIILTGWDVRSSIAISTFRTTSFRLNARGELLNVFEGKSNFDTGVVGSATDNTGNVYFLNTDFSMLKLNERLEMVTEFDTTYQIPSFVVDNGFDSATIRTTVTDLLEITGVNGNTLFSYQIATDGTLNTNYGVDGIGTTIFEQYDEISRLENIADAQSNQKSVIALTASPSTNNFEMNQLVIARLQAVAPIDGSSDKTFNLINASNNTIISSLENGGVYTINSLTENYLNIQLDTKSDESFKSYKLALDGPVVFSRLENQWPIALFGDSRGNYYGNTLSSGAYSLNATPYTLVNGKGEAGSTISIEFTIVDTANQVTDFALYNSNTNEVVTLIEEGAVLSLAADTAYAIVAQVASRKTSSVVLTLEGAINTTRTENVAPYALFGDFSGRLKGRSFLEGDYKLTGTPFTKSGGAGQLGVAKTLSFSVTIEQGLTIAPNPIQSKQIQLHLANTARQGDILSYSLYDISGRPLLNGKFQIIEGQKEVIIDASEVLSSPGVYSLRVSGTTLTVVY